MLDISYTFHLSYAYINTLQPWIIMLSVVYVGMSIMVTKWNGTGLSWYSWRSDEISI